MRPLAFALLVVGGGCGGAEGLARQQAEEIEAIHARLEKLEAEQARIAAQRLPFEKELEAANKQKAAAEELSRTQAKELEAVTAKLDELEAEQARMETERAALEKEIEAAKGDELKRHALEARLVDLDKKLTALEAESH